MKFVPKELKETADISRGQITRRKFARNVAGVLLAFVCLYFFLGFAAELIASHISEKWETRLFQNRFSSDQPDSEAFHNALKIFDRMVRNTELRPLKYQLVLLDLPVLNAIAFPGGYVGITPLLLEEVTGETGLAMILGHELGHHQKRHCLKRMGRQLLYLTATTFLFGQGQDFIVTNSLRLAELRYSRGQEREADEFGLKLVYDTYGHTEGCLEFFELVLKDYESGSKRWGELFATHPFTPERISRLRRLQNALRSHRVKE